MTNQCVEYTGSDSANSGNRVRDLRYKGRKVGSAVQSVCLLVVLGDLLMAFTFLSTHPLDFLLLIHVVVTFIVKGEPTEEASRGVSIGME